jgi:hypothetical protein
MSSKIKKATNGYEHQKQVPSSSSSDDDDEPIRAPVKSKIEVRRID